MARNSKYAATAAPIRLGGAVGAARQHRELLLQLPLAQPDLQALADKLAPKRLLQQRRAGEPEGEGEEGEEDAAACKRTDRPEPNKGVPGHGKSARSR